MKSSLEWARKKRKQKILISLEHKHPKKFDRCKCDEYSSVDGIVAVTYTQHSGLSFGQQIKFIYNSNQFKYWSMCKTIPRRAEFIFWSCKSRRKCVVQVYAWCLSFECFIVSQSRLIVLQHQWHCSEWIIAHWNLCCNNFISCAMSVSADWMRVCVYERAYLIYCLGKCSHLALCVWYRLLCACVDVDVATLSVFTLSCTRSLGHAFSIACFPSKQLQRMCVREFVFALPTSIKRLHTVFRISFFLRVSLPTAPLSIS